MRDARQLGKQTGPSPKQELREQPLGQTEQRKKRKLLQGQVWRHITLIPALTRHKASLVYTHEDKTKQRKELNRIKGNNKATAMCHC